MRVLLLAVLAIEDPPLQNHRLARVLPPASEEVTFRGPIAAEPSQAQVVHIRDKDGRNERVHRRPLVRVVVVRSRSHQPGPESADQVVLPFSSIRRLCPAGNNGRHLFLRSRRLRRRGRCSSSNHSRRNGTAATTTRRYASPTALLIRQRTELDMLDLEQERGLEAIRRGGIERDEVGRAEEGGELVVGGGGGTWRGGGGG